MPGQGLEDEHMDVREDAKKEGAKHAHIPKHIPSPPLRKIRVTISELPVLMY
jgi:hypothetical protein